MTASSKNPLATPSPADLRNMFGANLRHLSKVAPSISALCRDLGINRTQFNRYLSGESFPRPDVLYKICQFFDVDARILLEPVDEIAELSSDLFHHPEIRDFLGSGTETVSEELMPSGLYRFSRGSFMDNGTYVVNVVQIYRKDSHTFVRGYEAKEAMVQQGLPATPKAREFRGFVMPQEGGVALLVSRRNALTFSFTYLSPQSSFDNNYWVGYTARTARDSVTGKRAARLVVEHINGSFADKLRAMRSTGLCSDADLLPYHRTQLQVGKPFS